MTAKGEGALATALAFPQERLPYFTLFQIPTARRRLQSTSRPLFDPLSKRANSPMNEA
jgi:hypothetical protein